MRVIRVAGLCLAGVLVSFSIIASSAQAAPALGQCVKDPDKGKFEDKGCTKRATQPKQAKFEFESLKEELKYESLTEETKLTAIIKGQPLELECKSSKDNGEFLVGGNRDKDIVIFKGCELKPFGVTCQTATRANGEIVSDLLNSNFLGAGEKGNGGLKAPAAGEIWLQYEPVANHPFAEWECAGVKGELTGSISGKIPSKYIGTPLKVGKKTNKGDKPSFTAVFEATAGEQALKVTTEGETVAANFDGTSDINLFNKGEDFEP